MLWAIVLILLILWAIGFVALPILGGFNSHTTRRRGDCRFGSPYPRQTRRLKSH